ncbi:MAG: hypothetical protein AB7O68_09980 [Pirellulales bacterium]
MSKNKHDHAAHHHGDHHHASSPRRGLHKDWRLWAAVVLMLVAMAAYVATMDESLGPDAPPGGQPADTAAPAAADAP